MKFSVVTPLWQDRPAAENMEIAVNADRLGYPELWIGEMATYDAFAFATAFFFFFLISSASSSSESKSSSPFLGLRLRTVTIH